MYKVCSVCGDKKKTSEFHNQPRGLLGVEGQCKFCRGVRMAKWRTSDAGRKSQRLRTIRYRATTKGRSKIREVMSRYNASPLGHIADRLRRERAPHKLAARAAVRRAIRLGLLIKPPACQSCGTVGKVEGHHPDYFKPLEVDWLCRPCHERVHP